MTLYLSSHGFTTTPTDSPANTHCDGLLVQPWQFERRLVDQTGISGRASAAGGEIAIWNGDGAYDSVVNGQSIDGRRVLIKRGYAGAAYSTFETVYDGTAEGWQIERGMVRLKLRDLLAKLEAPAQGSLYGGTGGADGGADLTSKPKPLCYGKVFNVAPVLVEAATRLYQVHDGQIKDVPTVRDKGAPLSKVAGTPTVGEYSVDLTAGTITLGAAPSGDITCDIEGDSGAGYISTAADILARLLARAGLPSSDIDGVSLSQLAFDAPAQMGIYQGAEAVPMVQLLDRVLTSIGGYAGGSRGGKLQMGVLKAPSGTAAFDLSDADIVDIEELQLPPAIYPPPRRVRVGYAQNYAPSSNLATAVSDADRAFLTQQFRYAEAYSSTVATTFLLAQEPGAVDGLYVLQADAQTEATRLLALYAPGRRMFEVTTRRYLWQMELGYTGTLTYADYGLSGGLPVVCVGWQEDAATGLLKITLFG